MDSSLLLAILDGSLIINEGTSLWCTITIDCNHCQHCEICSTRSRLYSDDIEFLQSNYPELLL